MNLKTGLIASILMNIALLSLVFYVKHNITEQAKDAVKGKQEKFAEQSRQVGEIFDNNNLLWELVFDIQNSPDKSIANVITLAKDKRLKNRENEKAMLLIEATTLKGQKARRIGWEKYSFMTTFDAKDNLVAINVDDLLGRAAPVSATASEQ